MPPNNESAIRIIVTTVACLALVCADDLRVFIFSIQVPPELNSHAIHPAIHWRSDTDSSIQLGEALAISVLQDRALTYHEKFTVNFTKIDGTTATISNQ